MKFEQRNCSTKVHAFQMLKCFSSPFTLLIHFVSVDSNNVFCSMIEYVYILYTVVAVDSDDFPPG